MTEDLTPGVIALLGLAALAAGWIDAVVGGGGLIQLPALLIGIPSATPAQLLATNKVSSIFGTATSSVTYFRRVGADLRTALPMAGVAYLGAIGGAVIGLHIPKSAFYPIILVLLVVVGAYTILRPDLGRESIKRFHGHKHVALAMLTGFVIGVYDGALGPGTEGAVSVEGTAAGLGGGAIVGGVGAAVGLYAWPLAAVVAIAGLLGSLAESVMGTVAERNGWMGNDLLNAFNTAAGAGIAMGIVWMTGWTTSR